MKRTYLILALSLTAIYFFPSCQKGVDGTTTPVGGGGGGGGPTAADSMYLPYSIGWTNFGFGNPGSYGIGVLYDAQKRVTQIGGGNVYVKQFYYPDGRVSHILAESVKFGNPQKERNSIVFKYSGNKIVQAIYKGNSFLPETDSYYSDTLRTNNNTGYTDSIIYSGNKVTEIYHKANFYLPQPIAYKFLVKYPNGNDSTYSIESYSGGTVAEYKISGKISNIANPYTPYWALYFHYFNGLDYSLYYPGPLRRDAYRCEYLLPLLPNAISTFKVEWFTGTYSFEQGNFLYQMSPDSLNLKMTNPGNANYNYERMNFLYNRVRR